jgi:ABC-type lipoprotein export system ATPase subunit
MEHDQEEETHETTAPITIDEKAPTVLIVMGMAGSGKTTFVHVSHICDLTLFSV